MKKNSSEKNGADHICRCTPLHVMALDGRLRRILQNPEKILKGLVSSGMTVIDIGCGPGAFTRAMAKMAGEKGTVIAVDVQREMLECAEKRLQGCLNYGRIRWHLCRPDSIGLEAGTEADFILSFHMVHEVSDRDRLFFEVYELLRPGGRYLVAEPKFHVSEEDFEETLLSAQKAGFLVDDMPDIRMNRTAVLKKPGA